MTMLQITTLFEMIAEGKVAISFFLAYILLTVTSFQDVRHSTDIWNLKTQCAYVGLSLSATRIFPHSSVAARAAFLGVLFGAAILLSIGDTPWKHFGWYLASLSLFHLSEYVVVAIYSPDKLSLDSFLLNHSVEYQIAAIASWTEFALELWLLPQMKSIFIFSFFGLLMMIGGEALRKLAMITAESNFTHIIQTRKDKNHVLVTYGIYSICRHPGYAGWFWWSIGTQVTLINPVCLVGYIWASWKFFDERIHDEEITLIHFFGDEYLEYQKRVPASGVPFVKGFSLTPSMNEKD